MTAVIIDKPFSIKIFLLYGILALAFVGMLSYNRFNYLPATQILELLFFSFSLFYIKRIKKSLLPFLILATFYVVYSFFIAVILQKVHILDFLQAYKAFIYVPFLSFFVGKNTIDSKFISKLFKTLLFFFLIKYSYSHVFGITKRPGVFTENNFELIFLLLVFYLNFIYRGKTTWVELIVLFIVFVLAGSRSAMVSFLFVYFMITIRKINKKTLVNILVLFLIAGFTSVVFLQRMPVFDLQLTDRYKFLMMFIHDTSNWEWWDFLIGNYSLRPMSDYVCQSLSYYTSLFSHRADGSCYSVILHSYILRVVFDHGILGFVFLIMFTKQGLKIMGLKTKEIITVLGTILITSLSVSAFNNIYITLALALFFAANYKTKIKTLANPFMSR